MTGDRKASAAPVPLFARRDRPVEVQTFESILFPAGKDREVRKKIQPDCLRDLNLDQFVGAIMASRRESDLMPVFTAPSRDPDVVNYRNAVFLDLEDEAVFALVSAFCDAMRGGVRGGFDYAGRIRYNYHRKIVLLDTAMSYCAAIRDLDFRIARAKPRSAGLVSFWRFLRAYAGGSEFAALSSEAASVREALSSVTYDMLIRLGRVTVRKSSSETDYALKVFETFERFRHGAAQNYLLEFPRDTSLNHVEAGILERVGKLYPEIFGELDRFCERHGDFVDATVERFDHEVQFYRAYLDYIRPIRAAGLNFCHPDVSASDKTMRIEGAFDLVLAQKLVEQERPVVVNDADLRDRERILVVSGPNQGGKTTFARMIGQIHFLASLGCPVPGRSAQVFLPDRILTHFEREEDLATLHGKLEDEMDHMRSLFVDATPDSLVILNEMFNATMLRDQLFLSKAVLDRIMRLDALAVCVTFIDELASLGEKTVSVVSTVKPEDPAERTFRIVRCPADGLAYALSLAEKHGVTRQRLQERLSR